jgi:hypothetical protein
MRHAWYSVTTLAGFCALFGIQACYEPDPLGPLYHVADGGGAGSDPDPSTSDGGLRPKDALLDAGATHDEGGATGASASKCSVSFANDVLPAFSAAKCTTCHGSSLSPTIQINPDDADATYIQLTSLTLSGEPYVDAHSHDPAKSSITCHLAGQCGQTMPPAVIGSLVGGSSDQLKTVVASWLTCGAPQN